MKEESAMFKISARNVSKTFQVKNDGDIEKEFPVLQQFSIDVKEGEFLAILGPSGCGKSTFLNILGGLTEKTGGDIDLDGEPVAASGNNLGYVFQAYALFPWRTVLENVEIGLEIRGVSKRERQEIAREYIVLVGLEEFHHRYPHELSGGMKQRVAIARALAYQPEVLLMDEPFAALDAQTREVLQFELLRIWERNNKTILFVTHSIDEAIFLADRVAVMTARPGTVKQLIDIPLPRPRTDGIRNSKEFAAVRQQAWELLKDEVLLAQDPALRRIAAESLAIRQSNSKEVLAHEVS
jgi:NitT/TauT family transport system ATP-binding protein